MHGRNSHLDGTGTGIVVIAAALMILGLVMLCSVGATLKASVFEGLTWNAPLARQAIFAAVGLIVILLGTRVGPGFLRWRPGSLLQPSILVLLVAVALLVALWSDTLGHSSHGKTRWLTLGSVRFQPSEVAKFALIVFLAAFLSRPSKRRPAAKPDLCIPIIAIAIVCGLVVKEDFGSAVLLGTVAACMILVRGCTLATVAAWTVPVVGAVTFFIISQPYRIVRLFSYRDIWDDPGRTDYQIVQSLAAIASGGWTGRGLGAGLAKYSYLPEARTDFIFAIICEEAGLLGGAMVILLYAAFILLGIRIMRRATSNDGGMGRLFAFGVTLTFGLQAAFNVAVVTVVAPTKGIGLPLVSAGGTGLLCFCAAIGLLAGTPRSHAPVAIRDPELLDCAQPGLLSGAPL